MQDAQKQQKLTFISIDQLEDERFVIPDYQRGYRWQPQQVEQLLDDLWDYSARKGFAHAQGSDPQYYCLQPIVVSLRDDGRWEVIDGQQRLTTVSLILEHLNWDLFQIEYESRNAMSNKMDEEYKRLAREVIGKWFDKEHKGGNGSIFEGKSLIRRFQDLLADPQMHMAHFIWYNVTDEVKNNSSLAIDIFDRLNIGKIGLTNAELIKALFMTFIDSKTQDAQHKSLNQVTMGTEWDDMESTLQEPLFWNFICADSDKYVTRIEYIFDILMEKADDDEDKFTFNKYVKLLKSGGKTVEDLWGEVKTMFQQFDGWYHDKELFHYIGYLTATDKSVRSILELLKQQKTKKEFKNALLKECLDVIQEIDIDDEKFYENNYPTDIRKVLLLFNVMSITATEESSFNFTRFPFDEYNETDEKGNCKWDIEHIHSQTPQDSQGKDKQEWLAAMLFYLTGKDDSEQWQEEIDRMTDEEHKVHREHCIRLLQMWQRIKRQEKQDTLGTEFLELYNDLRRHYESGGNINIHSLGNLTLLDKWTNRSYQNAFFPVKRSIIINNAKQGKFIPLCTQNVFLKAYSKHLGTLTEWNQSDCDDYLEEIKSKLHTNEEEPATESNDGEEILTPNA